MATTWASLPIFHRNYRKYSRELENVKQKN
jgi:hypothetical protein